MYSGYLQRQEADIVTMRKEEMLTLPPSLDYLGVSGLSRELQERLMQVRPATLSQAARIEGMTPAALALLIGHVKRRELRKSA